jgi:hypothetical protein
MSATLSRKLLGYKWELREHKVALIDEKNDKEIVLDKVRLMSFMKFAPNCLDKMRIEDCKKLRKQIKDTKEKSRVKKVSKTASNKEVEVSV